jgi:NADPH:quinone reductase-like Zn-dependent oxidoreductase
METKTMRAVVHDRYGPPEVQRIEEIERPVPQDDEVLVRVRATTVTQTDCHMRRAKPIFWRFMLGLRRPKRRTLGQEFAGEVEAVGSHVTGFAVGDRVFGMRIGAHAEFVCVRQSRFVAHMPASMTFDEAAAICDGAYQGIGCMRAGDVQEGRRVVVYGASGSCGTACVQLAKHLGAHVTAVTETRNLELVRSLGADEVIDYTREDFGKNGQKYDAVIDAVGKRRSFLRNRRSLRPGGAFVPTDGIRNLVIAPLTRLGRRRMRFNIGKWAKEDLLFFKQLIEAGEYRAVIDSTYPLEEVVEATKRVDSWQKTGAVVLTV